MQPWHTDDVLVVKVRDDINTYTKYDLVYNLEYRGSDGRGGQWEEVEYTVWGLEVDVS
jgi:hypothetical protein